MLLLMPQDKFGYSGDVIKCKDEKLYPPGAVREVAAIRRDGVAMKDPHTGKLHAFKILRLKALIGLSFGKLEGPIEPRSRRSQRLANEQAAKNKRGKAKGGEEEQAKTPAVKKQKKASKRNAPHSGGRKR